MALRRHRWATVLPLLTAFVLGTPVGASSGHDCCTPAPEATGVVAALPADALVAPNVAAGAGRMDHTGLRSAGPHLPATVPSWSAPLALVLAGDPAAAAVSVWAQRGPPRTGPPVYIAIDSLLL